MPDSAQRLEGEAVHGKLDTEINEKNSNGKDGEQTGAAPLTAIATKGLLDNLTSLLKESTKKAAFAISGSIPVTEAADNASMSCTPVTIRWDSPKSSDAISSRITFPVLDKEKSQFEKLLSDCQPASFGRGNRDVYDEDYRKAGKLDESQFSTNFSPYKLGIVDTISRILLPGISTNEEVDREVSAELYKLNVYSAPSGKFKSHVDTPRSTSQFGSLVVCLPSIHAGGQLVVRHGNDEVDFDWSNDQAANSVSWAAFYSDCEHEVFEVTGGHRVTLTYNLYFTTRARTPSFEAFDPTTTALYAHVRDMLAQPGFMSKGGLLGLYCAHAYAHTVKQAIKHIPMNLKGIDMIAYRVLTAAGLNVTLRPVAENRFEEDHSDPDWFRQRWREEWGDIDEWVKSERDDCEALPTDMDPYESKQRAWMLPVYRDALKFQEKNRSVLGKKLIPLVVTLNGGEGSDVSEIYDDWGVPEEDEGHRSLDGERKASPPYDYVKVRWLNRATHREPALIHATYGNEAGIDTIYSAAALIITVPPFHARSPTGNDST